MEVRNQLHALASVLPIQTFRHILARGFVPPQTLSKDCPEANIAFLCREQNTNPVAVPAESSRLQNTSSIGLI
jgi:hypothetical protein